MRISTNTLSENMVRQIQQLGSQQSKLQTQVATGQRIFQPEDDPNAVGRVMNLSTEQRQIAQFLHNGTRALELSRASFSSLQQVKRISDRAGEIGTLGAGAIGPDASRAYASELNQLIEQTLQFTNTKFRNDYLFGGTAVDAPPFVASRDAQGRVSSVAYVGNDERSAIQLSENATIAAGTASETNLGLRDFLTHLISLRDALTNSDAAGITAAQTNLEQSEDLVVNVLAEHGGIETRLEANQAQQNERADNIESLLSEEADADLPSTIVRLNQAQTAYQAALQSAANIMRVSLLDYIK